MERSPSSHGENLDRAAILQQLDGDTGLLTELFKLFLEEAPQLVESMRKAIEQGDSQTLARSAHSLKGAVNNFFAHRTAGAAAKLEDDAKRGDFDSARIEIPRLEALVEGLISELRNLCEESVQ